MIFQTKTKSANHSAHSEVALIFLALSSFGLTMAALGVYKANASTSQLTVDATIVGTILIDCTNQPLHFGTIIPSGALGTVEVDTANGFADSGGVTYVSGAASGACTVEGNASAPYEIDYVVSVLDGPGVDMTLTNLVTESTNSGSFSGLGTHTASLDGAGEDTLMIGGTLNVGANQAGGLYTGTIEATVDYP